MTFYVENETEFEFDFDAEKLLKAITEDVIKAEDVPFKDVTVNLTFTDEETIKETNKEFRDIDKVTDVLSFPSLDLAAPGVFTGIEEGDPSYFDPETGELILGDIMICVKRAMEQAEEYGHSLKREIAFLITHSLLHLLGYDHMEDSERLVMEDKQRTILNDLGITREN